MVTAATSSSTEVAEELMSYFVDIGNKECFAALLYICFDLLRSDVVEELSWQHGLNDFYMPYKIQNARTLVEKVKSVPINMLAHPILYLSAARPVGERSQRAVQERSGEGAGRG